MKFILCILLFSTLYSQTLGKSMIGAGYSMSQVTADFSKNSRWSEKRTSTAHQYGILSNYAFHQNFDLASSLSFVHIGFLEHRDLGGRDVQSFTFNVGVDAHLEDLTHFLNPFLGFRSQHSFIRLSTFDKNSSTSQSLALHTGAELHFGDILQSSFAYQFIQGYGQELYYDNALYFTLGSTLYKNIFAQGEFGVTLSEGDLAWGVVLGYFL